MLLTIQVLNDLGIIILDTSNHGQPRTICFGGATAALSCHVSLAANQELLIFPVSFRSWPGPVSLGWYRCAVTSVKCKSSHVAKTYLILLGSLNGLIPEDLVFFGLLCVVGVHGSRVCRFINACLSVSMPVRFVFLRCLRLHSSEALCVNTSVPKESASSAPDFLTTLWGKVWGLAVDFGPELLGEHSQCLRRRVPIRGEDGQSLASTELLILRMEAATFLILENPDATEAGRPRSKVPETVMFLFLHIYCTGIKILRVYDLSNTAAPRTLP